ncbi:MAG: beta-propeller domain-containing protein [Alteromonadaceae bacterium]|nr:beta-propeller domain-containing protein [Alteromonadaceae bacterium]
MAITKLRFSEQGEYLRVVTTAGSRGAAKGFDHRLNVLTQQGNELTLVAQLPNETNDKPIGKVNSFGKVLEDVKAVRFYDKKAYVITFETTDPLYP